MVADPLAAAGSSSVWLSIMPVSRSRSRKLHRDGDHTTMLLAGWNAHDTSGSVSARGIQTGFAPSQNTTRQSSMRFEPSSSSPLSPSPSLLASSDDESSSLP